MIEGHGDDLYRYGDIKMNFSSNIFPDADLAGLEAHLRTRLNLIENYPPPAATELERLLAERYGVAESCVLATSGATDAIYLIAQTLRDAHTFTLSHPTFSEYEDACRLFGYEERANGRICWICNPNNPTGQVQPTGFIHKLAKTHQWVVADQSYEDYTLMPMMSASEAVRLGNVIQIRSLTKQYAIPGLRIGFVVAAADVIARLRQNYRPWAVNALASEAGKWLLRHHPNMLPHRSALLTETQRLAHGLNRIDGIDAAPTATNFMLCTIQPATAAMLKDWLVREKGILIRDAANFRGLTPHHFRVAAQTRPENDALIEAIRQFIQLYKPESPEYLEKPEKSEKSESPEKPEIPENSRKLKIRK